MKFGVFFLSQAPEGVTTPAETLRQELAQVHLAEELGFDEVWLAEHHQSTYCVAPDSLTYATYVAGVTQRIRIGLAVSVLPLRNPLDFAERVAFLDHLSGGRLDVGVGRGNSRTELETWGLTLDDRRDRFEEALDFTLRAWTERNFEFDGATWQFRNVDIMPRCLQEPHPPVFVASSGSVETMERIARRGLPILISESLMTPARVGDRLRQYEALAVEAGRSASDAIARSWIAQKTYLAATNAEAREFAAPYALWRHRKQFDLGLPGPSPSLTSKLRKHAAALKPVLNAPAMKDPKDLSGEDLVAFDLYGSPDEVIQRLQAFEREGVRNVILSFSYGGMPDEAVRRTMKLFAQEVMPALERSQIAA
jgi:alkanesulfonate monooxygenase SsuD/methylene tetrahydromethanopterin reductase-like flavin-dependent oxidoreductase (luciferase family)